MTALECIRAVEVPVLLEESPPTLPSMHQWAGFSTEAEWQDAVAAGDVCGQWVTDGFAEQAAEYNTALTVCLCRPGHGENSEGRTYAHLGYAVARLGGDTRGYQWMSDLAAPAPPITEGAPA